jgi:hypothetical protein
MNKYKWWMSSHVALWQIFNNKRIKIFHYNLEMGFDEDSSYWSAKNMSKEQMDWIISDLYGRHKD